MTFKKIFLLFFTAQSFIVPVSSQQNQEGDKHPLFRERGELYFKFTNPGQKIISQLSAIISIDRVEPDEVFAYANEKEFNRFSSFNLAFTPLTPPSLLHPALMKGPGQLKAVNDWDYYPTYEAYVEMMVQFATDYPSICTVFSIGQSINGRELLVAKISDNIGVNEGEAQFLYTSSIHGDETTGYILTLRLIDYLLSNYGSDPDVDELVDNLEIWINPLANPDGTYAGGNNTVNGASRYNANWVDLNRNYPDPEDGPHPDGNEWQQETLMFMQMAEDNQFIMSANFHGGAEVCNYPWDTWPDLHADDDWWQLVCHEYADTAQAYSPGGYMSGFDDGISNGYAWYTISGGRQDYMNYFHQCREFTLEISDTKLLPAYLLPDLWDYNYRSMLNYMKQNLYGLTGAVTDAITGDPLYAEVFIENHDIDSSWVYTYPVNGKYFRPLFEGTYDITFSSSGYYPQTIENVNIVNGTLNTLDVELQSGELIADFTASETQVSIGTAIDFTDLTYGFPISWEWTFEGAIPSGSTEQHPQNILYPDGGAFDVTLTVSDGTNSQTVIKEEYIVVSEEFIIQNTTVITCSGMFYDTGGAGGDYGDNEDFIMTFKPDDENSKLSLEFISFNVEYQSDCDYDWLRIYDGATVLDPLIGEYCGTQSPGTVTATNGEGALTVEFHSDYSVTASGWIAGITCEGLVMPPFADFTADTTIILVGGIVHFSDLSQNNPETWDWIFEGGSPAVSPEQSPVITYNLPGVYDVTLTVSNSTGSNTLTKQDYIVVQLPSGIVDLENNLRVFPNPASDRVHLHADCSIESVRIHSVSGEKMLHIFPGTDELSLPVHGLKEGAYILTILTERQVIHKKLEVIR